MTWRLDRPGSDAQCFDTEAEALAAQADLLRKTPGAVCLVWEMGDVQDMPQDASDRALRAPGVIGRLVGRLGNDERRSA